MAGSFIDNVNTVANAVNLATGDIVQDTTVARDEAVAAADSAEESKVNAEYYESLAHQWADKGHNSPVVGTVVGGTAEYSAYHWAVQSALAQGDPLINDALVSASYTWSSEKLNTELNGKASSAHNHNGTYEPAFVKGTAFNKNFGGNGSASTVARSDHNHNGIYEPVIPTKKTGFNLDVGITTGTLAAGDHLHTATYMPKVIEGTAYNKNFVADTNNPGSNEIPRGNHTHPATGISYTNTGNLVVTATTAQGAISQLDARVGSIGVAEKCYFTGGMTDATYSVAFSAVNTATVINAGITVDDNRNTIYSAGIQVNYAVAQAKLVQGLFDGSVTIQAAANKVYALRIAVNGVVDMASKVVSRHGSASSPAGTFSISLGCFVMGLAQGDKVALALVNETDSTSVTISAMSMSFSGEPEGALVISGSTVTHNDVLGRDVAGQHPTTAIYDTGSGTALNVILNGKADLVPTPTADNLVTMDALGELTNSGVSKASVLAKMDKVGTAVNLNLVAMDSTGNAIDSGKKVADLALKNGSTSNKFSIADGTATTDAVSKGQLDTLAATVATDAELLAHSGNTSNPHATTYTQVGAAAAVHTHAISDVTSLQTTLDNKYNKVTSPVTGNIVKFGAGGVLVDGGSGINTSTLVTKDSATGSAQLPVGTTAQRTPAPTEGRMRMNSDTHKPEVYNGTSWGSVGGGATGGGSDEVFIENSYVVTTNYTIPTGKSAVTVGDASGNVTINSGVTVTLESNSRWVVL